MTEVPPHLLDAMRERVWIYTASVFAVAGKKPTYVGTATCVSVSGHASLLTAAHVWSALRGERFALSLESERLLVPIHKSIVDATVFDSKDSSEWGPDLALLRLPELVARDIGQVKAFYNLDRRRPHSDDRAQYDKGVWAVIGAPAEQSTFGEKEGVLKISLFASVIAKAQERDAFDYADLGFYHEDRPDLPASYGGISGSGLWHLPIQTSDSGTVSWNDEARLEGVAFYQKPTGNEEGVIRCHGRKSLYEQVAPASPNIGLQPSAAGS